MRVCARSSPWITPDQKKRMHDRNILKIKAIKSNDPDDWMRYKKQRNLVNSEIRSVVVLWRTATAALAASLSLFYSRCLSEARRNYLQMMN